MKFPKSDLARNILLSIASTILILFLLEMMLRVTGLVPVRSLEYATPEMWARNPGPLRPGQSYTDRFKRGLPYTVSVNNLGLRGEDMPLAKAPGVKRVLCLGDSYTFGAYVNNDETWPAQLQSTLQERDPNLPVQVVNGGISGFTIVDELSFLTERGLDLQPDVVVVAFVLNDLADLTRKVSSREMLRISSTEAARSTLGQLKLHLRQTAIYNALFVMRAYVAKSTGNDPTIQEVDIRHLLKPDYDQETLDLFEKYRQHLAEMKRICDQRRIRLIFVIFPYWEQISQTASDQAQRRLTELAGSLGIQFLDLLPSYKQHDPKGRKFFNMPLDHHPSARGYRRAAYELAPIVEPLLGPALAPAPRGATSDPAP